MIQPTVNIFWVLPLSHGVVLLLLLLRMMTNGRRWPEAPKFSWSKPMRPPGDKMMNNYHRYNLVIILTGWCHGSNRCELFHATIIQPYIVLIILIIKLLAKQHLWGVQVMANQIYGVFFSLCSFCKEMMRSCWNKRRWAIKPWSEFSTAFDVCGRFCALLQCRSGICQFFVPINYSFLCGSISGSLPSWKFELVGNILLLWSGCPSVPNPPHTLTQNRWWHPVADLSL